jgi:hypothetical protein
MRVAVRCALSALGMALAGCDPIGYGYINKLHYPVTVVHHLGNTEKRLLLAAGERRPPQLGDSRGQRDEFFDQQGRLIATFSAEQMRTWHRHDVPPVLAISRSGVTVVEPWWRSSQEANP